LCNKRSSRRITINGKIIRVDAFGLPFIIYDVIPKVFFVVGFVMLQLVPFVLFLWIFTDAFGGKG